MLSRFSHVRLFAAPWTVAHQAPLSMGFFRKEYWRGLPFLSPGDLSSPEMESWSPALQADSLPSEPPGKPNFKITSGKYFLSHISIQPCDSCLYKPLTLFLGTLIWFYLKKCLPNCNFEDSKKTKTKTKLSFPDFLSVLGWHYMVSDVDAGFLVLLIFDWQYSQLLHMVSKQFTILQ